jgi:hypothetical protein
MSMLWSEKRVIRNFDQELEKIKSDLVRRRAEIERRRIAELQATLPPKDEEESEDTTLDSWEETIPEYTWDASWRYDMKTETWEVVQTESSDDITEYILPIAPTTPKQSLLDLKVFLWTQITGSIKIWILFNGQKIDTKVSVSDITAVKEWVKKYL